jgi:trehalose synthase
VQEVRVAVRPLSQFIRVVGRERFREALQIGATIRQRLAERVLWNVNSTAVGGGVAEMLRPLLGYSRSLGIDARWMVIAGRPDFFRITKRLHHALHGSPGDGSPLAEEEHGIYENELARCARNFAFLVRPGDVVLLHDPQTAGLAPRFARSGALVIWRSHIGSDQPNEEVERGWRFLSPYLDHAAACVFTRSAYVPSFADGGKATVIQPSIDAFSAKNRTINQAKANSILVHAGLVEGPSQPEALRTFTRDDGSVGRVERRARVVRTGRAPLPRTPLVVQVSRWDSFKDPIGVMRGFAALLDGEGETGAELILAGPDPRAVADDPEGPGVFEGVVSARRALPDSVRDRIHVASLPTADVEENAAIVNALQRRAAVVVQKSLREGFGLTVTEAMWKARPVVASGVGGIQDQIEHGVSGILLGDPTDLAAFAEGLRRVLADPARAKQLGEAARERVRVHFLGIRHLLQYASLIQRLDDS